MACLERGTQNIITMMTYIIVLHFSLPSLMMIYIIMNLIISVLVYPGSMNMNEPYLMKLALSLYKFLLKDHHERPAKKAYDQQP